MTKCLKRKTGVYSASQILLPYYFYSLLHKKNQKVILGLMASLKKKNK